jgi:hypothetical protein
MNVQQTQHILGYCCNYYFGEWNTCSEGGLPPFPSPYSMMNGYSYYQKMFGYFDGHCHYWSDSHRYDATNIDDDNTCNDNGYLKKYMILH